MYKSFQIYLSDKNGTAFMTDYALANIDECCLVFKKGYTYESVYYNQKIILTF